MRSKARPRKLRRSDLRLPLIPTGAPFLAADSVQGAFDTILAAGFREALIDRDGILSLFDN